MDNSDHTHVSIPESSAEYVSGEPTNLSVSNSNLESIQPEISIQTESGDPSHSYFSEQSASALSPEIQHEPRRTGRARKPPDKYGDWISHQQSVVDADSNQIWYMDV